MEHIFSPRPLLSFALSGYPMSRTQAAPVAYMCGDLYKPGSCCNFPKEGGALGGVVDAMRRGAEEKGGQVEMGATVTSLIMSEASKPRCIGVRCTKGGKDKTYMTKGAK